jgi:hypothetical protein
MRVIHAHTIRVGLFLVRLDIDAEGRTHPRLRLLSPRAIPRGDLRIDIHGDDFAFPWQLQFGTSQERVIERCDVGRIDRLVVQCANASMCSQFVADGSFISLYAQDANPPMDHPDADPAVQHRAIRTRNAILNLQGHAYCLSCKRP